MANQLTVFRWETPLFMDVQNLEKRNQMCSKLAQMNLKEYTTFKQKLVRIVKSGFKLLKKEI